MPKVPYPAPFTIALGQPWDSLVGLSVVNDNAVIHSICLLANNYVICLLFREGWHSLGFIFKDARLALCVTAALKSCDHCV